MSSRHKRSNAFDGDQVQAWKDAVAKWNRQQRNRRGRRSRGVATDPRPGMMRRPAEPHDSRLRRSKAVLFKIFYA